MGPAAHAWLSRAGSGEGWPVPARPSQRALLRSPPCAPGPPRSPPASAVPRHQAPLPSAATETLASREVSPCSGCPVALRPASVSRGEWQTCPVWGCRSGCPCWLLLCVPGVRKTPQDAPTPGETHAARAPLPWVPRRRPGALSYGCSNQAPQLGSFTSEARSPKWRCGQGHLPGRCSGRILPAPGGCRHPWLVAASRQPSRPASSRLSLPRLHVAAPLCVLEPLCSLSGPLWLRLGPTDNPG